MSTAVERMPEGPNQPNQPIQSPDKAYQDEARRMEEAAQQELMRKFPNLMGQNRKPGQGAISALLKSRMQKEKGTQFFDSGDYNMAKAKGENTAAAASPQTPVQAPARQTNSSKPDSGSLAPSHLRGSLSPTLPVEPTSPTVDLHTPPLSSPQTQPVNPPVLTAPRLSTGQISPASRKISGTAAAAAAVEEVITSTVTSTANAPPPGQFSQAQSFPPMPTSPAPPSPTNFRPPTLFREESEPAMPVPPVLPPANAPVVLPPDPLEVRTGVELRRHRPSSVLISRVNESAVPSAVPMRRLSILQQQYLSASVGGSAGIGGLERERHISLASHTPVPAPSDDQPVAPEPTSN